IDGKKIGETVGGYSSHTFDITPFVRFGKDHVLAVTADNSRKDIPPFSADFTFMGGVYRDAWLLAVHDLHLDIVGGPEEGFAVRSFLSDDGKWCSEVSGVVVNDSDAKAHVEVRMTVYDASGCPLCDCVKEAVG
ncbi:MAG: glycoside hydrolase family 2, partial [Muribaculaceae bacterium]|nr:glycoside hydrolase family 2 [Muribaculaceae bacterium]